MEIALARVVEAKDGVEAQELSTRALYAALQARARAACSRLSSSSPRCLFFPSPSSRSTRIMLV